MKLLSHLAERSDTLLRWLLIVLMALLLIDVSWQVLTRFILPKPSSFTEELARFLLIWIGLLGSAHAYRHKMHLGIDVFVRTMSSNKALVVSRFVQLITLAFALAVLVYGGSKLVLLAYHLEQKSAAMQINMGLVYLALPISGALFALFALEQMFAIPQSTEELV
ncbi:TRAP transporter small permease [Glaciecola sp. MH2013]|uniref:TRAP transporter small permease n=1 Tax=Glaciecola sp. MH2013 TaxID=2785524 RepID=UPI00189DAC12|nr:TRAP transporter small permease [Glaciecola sp. MH2013]MBF7073675.1 TRAP transporter small permease [Glaciecola sp. MH2013]